MAASKATRARPTRKPQPVGLMAIGSCGSWEVAIDQSAAGRDRWFAQIDGPSVYLYFEIQSPNIIHQATTFFTQGTPGRNGPHAARGKMLTLGTSKSAPVNLIRDDEFTDRYFLVVEPKSGPLVRLTVAGDDLAHLIGALRQAIEDLGDNT
jgi:hypothetical protein